MWDRRGGGQAETTGPVCRRLTPSPELHFHLADLAVQQRGSGKAAQTSPGSDGATLAPQPHLGARGAEAPLWGSGGCQSWPPLETEHAGSLVASCAQSS